MKRKTLLIAAWMSLQINTAQAKQSPLIIHEWGTFTSFMGSNGKLLEGMHTEEEALPGFVYSLKKDGNISNLDIIAQSSFGPCPRWPTKAPCDVLSRLSEQNQNFLPGNPITSGVTQKMETPVIYFYGEEGEKLDIKIDFPKGIISQWYPKATDYYPSRDQIETLGPSTLKYSLLLKSKTFTGNIPKTTHESIWNPARVVNSNTIEVNNEHEKFIFYRGIGDFPSSLKLTSEVGNKITLTNLLDEHITGIFVLNSDGIKGNFKRVGSLAPHHKKSLELPSLENGIAFEQYVINAKKTIHKYLVGAGLYNDEAWALLNTWEKSYFVRPS